MPGEAGIQGTLRVVEELGADSFVYVTPRDPTLADAITQAVVRVEGRQRLEKGEPVGLVVDPTDVHVFDAASGERLSA
jgi:multiple sugar transport system ATP-binding protein